jgi:predicted nucleic acid-binding protein
MAVVDTNVVLDLTTNDPNWTDWSHDRPHAAGIRGPVLANAGGCIEQEL